MQSGAFRGMHVIVYRGYVADNVAKVRVRVVEEPELPGDSRIPYWDVMQANLRRHGALAIVGVDVELRIAGNTAHEVTDSAASPTSLPVPKLPAGWHDAHAVTTPIEDGESASGSGRVLKPAAKAPFAVISDIDDTILVSGLTEGLTALKQTLCAMPTPEAPSEAWPRCTADSPEGYPGPSGAQTVASVFFLRVHG